MGCDGGTIPTRDELVKTKKKPEQKDKDAERLYRWRHCALSQERLKSPIVVCELGRMYNKLEILTRLLNRTSEPVMSHVRAMRDIKDANLTQNPAYCGDEPNRGEEYVDSQASEFVCPVSSLEMNGRHRFCVLWGCGCVVSERALKEVKSEVCHKCGQQYSEEDVIILNPTEEELLLLQASMEERRARVKALKKAKKDIKRPIEHEEGVTASTSGIKKVATTIAGTTNGKKESRVNGGLASSLLRDKEFENVRSAGFSVAKDPKASEVYKSIFDTHKSAQKKSTAHWVTCNPQYFG